ncbi:hypothetical protein SCOR_05115 [Sulfidibacter corallicola]|uniref:5-bromo-4-chloroindolyl phosphate hydrolysis protein n=1 Tax=Sulfidibacter corallicola TaxID=2818388 RepID=A0A8A4TR10_SULCO|nr:hypothetical protein [Sulfidibacter corallicola]QTD51847.1 hypothetical protein J3U87_05195 [Sulfidibacter corallicola]
MAHRESRDEWNAGKVARAVFWEAVQHPTTLYPAAVSVLCGVYMSAFGVSAGPIKGALAGAFASLGSWVFHYFVRGEKLAARMVQKQLAAREDRATKDFEAELARFASIGFAEGRQALLELREAFEKLDGYLRRQGANRDHGTIVRFQMLAADCYREGQVLLRQARDIQTALVHVDAAKLVGEITSWERQLQRRTADDAAAGALRTRIESHRRRLEQVRQRQGAVAELLAEVEILEAALETAYLEVVDLVGGKFTPVRTGEHTAASLENAVSAARRVEDRLRGLERGPDEAADEAYLAAGKHQSPRDG